MITIRIKTIIEEDFSNYKLPSMFIGVAECDFKCSEKLCQNHSLIDEETHEISEDELLSRYQNNPIPKAIVLGGLEPMLQFDEVEALIRHFRYAFVNDPFIIYTGYNRDEIVDKINILSRYTNIIVKFGRYIPGHAPHFDEVLGVKLASDNQYAERIS